MSLNQDAALKRQLISRASISGHLTNSRASIEALSEIYKVYPLDLWPSILTASEIHYILSEDTFSYAE